MKPVLVLDVVGLTSGQIGAETPNLRALAARGVGCPMAAVLPALTLSGQATMLTGLPPAQHGAVGNGWFDRSTGEVRFWQQSNALVDGQKLYERARARDGATQTASHHRTRSPTKRRKDHGDGEERPDRHTAKHSRWIETPGAGV